MSSSHLYWLSCFGVLSRQAYLEAQTNIGLMNKKTLKYIWFKCAPITLTLPVPETDSDIIPSGDKCVSFQSTLQIPSHLHGRFNLFFLTRLFLLRLFSITVLISTLNLLFINNAGKS